MYLVTQPTVKATEKVQPVISIFVGGLWWQLSLVFVGEDVQRPKSPFAERQIGIEPVAVRYCRYNLAYRAL